MLKAKIFISYKRDAEPDDKLAEAIAAFYYDKGFDVFLDKKNIGGGNDYDKEIPKAIKKSDFFLVLLSRNSRDSDFVLGELRIANATTKEFGKPIIIPIILDEMDHSSLGIESLLGRAHAIKWCDQDGGSFFEALISATKIRIGNIKIKQNPSHSHSHSHSLLSAETSPYIHRKADDELEECQRNWPYRIYIQGPSQAGKTSLLRNAVSRAQDNGFFVINIDFQTLSSDVLNNIEKLCKEFALLVEQSFQTKFVDFAPKLEAFWDNKILSPTKKFELFIKQHILPSSPTKILLALDDMDVFLNNPVRSDFFAMIRSCFNPDTTVSRKQIDASLSVVMTGSIESTDLINNGILAQFNIMQDILVDDFSLEECSVIWKAFGKKIDRFELEILYDVLGGHPYLTRLAIQQSIKTRFKISKILNEAKTGHGQLATHISSRVKQLENEPNRTELFDFLFKAAFEPIPETKVIREAKSYILERLITTGLLRVRYGKVVARNKLYENYLKAFSQG